MITKKQYNEAQIVVAKYEAQLKQAIVSRRNGIKFKRGERVRTTKGCRIKKYGFEGVVVGKCMWGEYPAVKVKKDEGRIVVCLAKNLVHC